MTPFPDSRAHLLAELARLDVLLECRLAEWLAAGAVEGPDEKFVSQAPVSDFVSSVSATPSGSRSSGETSEGTGGGDAASSLAGDGTTTREHSADGTAARSNVTGEKGAGGDLPPAFEQLTREIQRRERLTEAAGTELRLVRIAEVFGLSSLQRDALLLVCAPELDSKYEQVYGFLQDDMSRTRPTVDLVLRLLTAADTERLAARNWFATDSPLVSARLVRRGSGESGPLPSRPLSVDDRVVAYLLGEDAVADTLADFTSVQRPRTALTEVPVDVSTRERLSQLADVQPERGSTHGSEQNGRGRSPTSRNDPLVYVHGPYGSGTDTAVDALCAAQGEVLVTAATAAVLARDIEETVSLLAREVHFQGAALHLSGLPSTPPGAERAEDTDIDARIDRLLRAVDRVNGAVYVTGESPLSTSRQLQIDGHTFKTLALPRPSYELRQQLWSAVEELPVDVDPDELAATFRFTPGQVRDAVETAHLLADGPALTRADVYDGCRAQSGDGLGTLAHPVPPTYEWNDIVLPGDRLAQLREVAGRIAHRGTVYDSWGFQEKYSLGNGLVVLFTGPSGTGKTMAADIIAGAAGLELYRIDLSSVVSKYIGETEKNVGRVFDEAAHSDAVLLFDEADALFGKRSAVNDAHDRYANIEVDYLLQRVEEHDGVVVLTTNFKENIDDAFLRRIHVAVDFPMPDRPSRRAIWRGVFPAETPVGDLDYDLLSRFEVAGGNIKNIALTAAFMAVEDGDVVEMPHVLRAMRREFQKTGRLVDPVEFGPYRDLL